MAALRPRPQKAKRRKYGSGRSWTQNEHALLQKVYAKKSFDELQKLFKRSRGAIKSRAMVLGIKRSNRRPWTKEEDAVVRQLYANTMNTVLATRLNRTAHSLYLRAKKFGIKKTAEFTKQQRSVLGRKLAVSGKAHRFPKGNVPANKGMRRPGWSSGRMRETQFKQGQRSGAAKNKWVPVGTVQMNSDGYLRRKIADEPESVAGKGGQSTNWEFVHRRVWEDAHGLIPKGYRIWWKDGDHTNCALENLELLSGPDHMARTTIHRVPPELKEVMWLNIRVGRQIKKRKRRQKDGKESVERPSRPPVCNARSAAG